MIKDVVLKGGELSVLVPAKSVITRHVVEPAKHRYASVTFLLWTSHLFVWAYQAGTDME